MSAPDDASGPQRLTLDFETPDGRLRGDLVVRPRPIRLAELAFNTMILSDKLTEFAVRREAREQREVSCRKGCGACCRTVVPLSAPEAWFLADLVAGVKEPRRSEILENLESASRAMSE